MTREVQLLTLTEWQVQMCQRIHTNVHLVVHILVFLTAAAYPRVLRSLLCTAMPDTRHIQLINTHVELVSSLD